ncbi:ATP-binding protein [Chitinophaga sedimenti]|uniref:ATP-binding protein n=1 Tax=Chitinophaga sedimenti TaxID=2033606 RepID=UPI002004175F|nr:ATP-binding protein [Chitinophaga sedimenti]MCK7555809.1 ATP-binding protein [Chitinophaga sedimenti]
MLHIDDGVQSLKKVIYGADSSGKTALIKSAYKKFYNNGYFPVYISGAQISDVTLEKLKHLIIKQFSAQYDELDGRFDQIDFTKIVLLVDDLHKFKYTTGKPALIHNLAKLFEYIIICGDELMQFDSFTDSHNRIVDPFELFDRYLLTEFGPKLRNDMIIKWYRLGKEYLDNGEKNEFLRAVDIASENISSIIGKNLIPAYPIYILSILQAMETGQQESTQNNLHAYYYEMLIKSYLKKSLSDPEDLGFYLGLCKEYCYFLFSEKIRFQPVEFEGFKKFLAHHEEKYSLGKLNPVTVFDVLVKGRIFKPSKERSISVTYKYIYYFFVAKYFSDNIDDAHVKELIDRMAERMYRDEYSNIILFLTHQSKNPYIIEKLLEKAKLIFSEDDMALLEDDVNFINDLQSTLPELVYQNIDVDEARDEDLLEQEALDKIEREFETNRKEDVDYDLNEDVNSINTLALLTKAMRTISIIGLITKKNWGEIVGKDKLRLAEETFGLGLRTLGHHFKMVKNSELDIVDHVKSLIHKRFIREKLNKLDIQNITKNFIFTLCATSTFGVLKNIINSIGSEKLSKTFQELIERYPNNSYKLAKLGIELAHFDGFPYQQLEQLKIQNEKNPLAFATIQNLVVDYLHMYDVAIERKQQICALLNIKIQEQRAIGSTSLVKKTS